MTILFDFAAILKQVLYKYSSLLIIIIIIHLNELQGFICFNSEKSGHTLYFEAHKHTDTHTHTHTLANCLNSCKMKTSSTKTTDFIMR